MKKIFTLLFLIICLNVFSQDFASINNTNETTSLKSNTTFDEDINDIRQTVFVCTGQYSYAYHSIDNCNGLNNCKGDIKYTDESFAIQNLGRKPCCICWSNVSNNCANDSARSGGNGGGGNAQESNAMAYAAVALVALSAAIISNDAYISPALSFDKNSKNELGWAFGFRKTFDNSALEYGASVVDENEYYDNYSWYENEEITEKQWGAHFNYIHHFFEDKTPHSVNIYAGPTLNYVDDFGIGGIIGSKKKIRDRWEFDFRYELTTETNRLLTGVIFKYQKEYFWKKK